MKTEKTKNKTIQVRLNQEDYELFKYSALAIGLDCSKMIRMFIDTTINQMKIKINKGEINLEDIKTLFNDKL